MAIDTAKRNAESIEIIAEYAETLQDWGDTKLGVVEPKAKPGEQATFAGLELHERLTVKGQPGAVEFEPGRAYRFWGKFTHHPKYGRQFFYSTVVECEPYGQQGVVDYLQRLPGIGNAKARKLWEWFKGDAIRKYVEAPAEVAELLGMSLAVVEVGAERLVELRDVEGVVVELLDILGGRGFRKDLASRLIQKYGGKAARLVKAEPYRLLKFSGCGWLRVDKLYLDLGLDPAAIERQARCVAHAIASDRNGHTWHEASVIEGVTRRYYNGNLNFTTAVLYGRNKLGILATRRDDCGKGFALHLADASIAEAESIIARRVGQMLDRKIAPTWYLVAVDQVAVGDSSLSIHQYDELKKATAARIGILAGSPGTGKTYATAAMLRGLLDMVGADRVAVCCPTGKAAVRISEALAEHGVALKARTIHSTLKVSEVNGSDFVFEYGPSNPLPFAYVVVDEASMLDVKLAAKLLDAIAAGSHLLLVGDPYQLPPVGPGAPLRDLIDGGIVPAGELTEIRRNAGTIVRCCASIRDDHKLVYGHGLDSVYPPEGSKIADAEPCNLAHIATRSPEASRREIQTLVEVECELSDEMGKPYPCFAEAQVVVAVNEKSELSRVKLNHFLQRQLNAGGKRVGSNPFAIGDKIICLRNGFYPYLDGEVGDDLNDDKKVYVANGEQGIVEGVAVAYTDVRLQTPERLVRVPRTATVTTEGCEWALAYAVSVHKSQGSQWPAVIVVIDEYPGARGVCSRNWLFTAISRAARVCYVVGNMSTAEGFCYRDATSKRQTMLKRLVAEAVENA